MKKKALKRAENILIFSDTHLSQKFEKPKFEYLKKLISAADQVIINGDFWDYYLTTWDDFVSSPWKQLFPLLKARKTVYVYGNHDQQFYSDDRVNLFSDVQTYEHILQVGKQTLHIQHGHLIVPTLDVRFSSIRYKALMRLSEKMEEFNVFFLSKPLIRMIARRQNRQMKNFLSRKLPDQGILVCGHSHLAEHNLECRFINTGWIRYGTAQALQIQNGKFTLLDSKY